MPPSPVVQRELLDKAETVIHEYEEALSLAQDENTKFKKTILKLKKAKNAKQVAKIVRENMEEADVFDELIKDIKKKLNVLDSVTVETLFVGQRREDYYPGRESSNYSWEETRRALEYKEVEINSEENGIHTNDNHPGVKNALNSIYELENWLEHASSEFIEWYMEEHDDYEPDLSDRTFWDNHLW